MEINFEPLEGRQLLSAGELDPTFGLNGANAIHVSANGTLGSITPLAGGSKLLVATEFDNELSFFRLNGDGSVDSTFGTNGRVIETFASDGKSVAIDSAGHIAVAGVGTVALFNADGSPVSTFGTNGVVTLNSLLGGVGGAFFAGVVSFTPDDKLFVATNANLNPAPPSGDRPDSLVLGLKSDGSADTSFAGGDGILPLGGESLSDLAISDDGHLFVATHYVTSTQNDSTTHVQIHIISPDGSSDNLNSVDPSLDDPSVEVKDLEPMLSLDGGVTALIYSLNADRSHYVYSLRRFSPSGSQVETDELAVPASWSAAEATVDNTDELLVTGFDSQNIWYAQRYLIEFGTGYVMDPTYGHAEMVFDQTVSVGWPEIEHPFPTTGDATVLPDGSVVFANTRDRANKPHDLVFAKLQGGLGTRIDVTLNSKGTLIVSGTASNDHIEVAIRPDGRLVVRGDDGFAKTFAPSRVKRIAVFANAGDDTVTIGSRVRGSYLDGGDGNDTLTGGDNADIIVGGAGDDSLSGGLAPDRIVGGDGNDTITGGGGADQLFGGNENDLLYGNGGNDLLSGDAGDDRLFGGGGADRLLGGDGSDSAANDPLDTRDSIEMLL